MRKTCAGIGIIMQRITKLPEIRRQEILDAAIRLFNEKGYEQTSMLDITKSINVSSGLCYRYFKSKEEIYQAALNSYVSQGVEYFVSLLGDENRPIIDIINTMPALNNKIDTNNPYHKFFNSAGNSNFHLQMEIELINRLITILSNRLELAQKNGEISVENPIAAAAVLLYGQLGIWQIKDLQDDIKIKDIRYYAKKIIGV